MKPAMWIAILVAVVAFVAWRAISGKRSSAEAHAAMDAGGVLVDVRTDGEFAQGHLPGAKNIPVQDLPARADEVGDKSKPVVVYCRSGQRSARAKRLLEEAGYEQVINLGPMSAW